MPLNNGQTIGYPHRLVTVTRNAQDVDRQNPLPVIAGEGELTLDAWGRQKTYTDQSLFSSKFTFDIPDKDWVLPPTTNGGGTVTSSNGALVINSGTSSGDYGQLLSRRHPTYQPNKGHLYSTALILPTPAATGFTRRWGAYYTDGSTFQSGVLFELKDGVLYGKSYTTYNGTLKESSVIIDYSTYSLDGGALFDIQFQWRGVGNIFFYINQVLVGTIENLGIIDTDNKVSFINPSLPARFECINTGGTGSVDIIAGCVDISSEGGAPPALRPAYIETALGVTVPATAAPLLILYCPLTYKSQHNTRDVRILKASLGMDKVGILRIIKTRDTNIFGNAVLGDISGETDFTWVETASTVTPGVSSLKYYTGATQLDLSDPTTYQLSGGGYAAKGGDNILFKATDEKDTDLVITHGDYLIISGEASASGTGYASVSVGEEI